MLHIQLFQRLKNPQPAQPRDYNTYINLRTFVWVILQHFVSILSWLLLYSSISSFLTIWFWKLFVIFFSFVYDTTQSAHVRLNDCEIFWELKFLLRVWHGPILTAFNILDKYDFKLLFSKIPFFHIFCCLLIQLLEKQADPAMFTTFT